jgi:hypothetical protein
MPIWEQLLLAGVVSLGLVVLGNWTVTQIAMSRRPVHQDTPRRATPRGLRFHGFRIPPPWT